MPASRVKGGACLRVVSPTYERTIVFSWLAYQARMMMCEGIRKHGGWNNEGDIHNFSSNGSYYARMRSCSPHNVLTGRRRWRCCLGRGPPPGRAPSPAAACCRGSCAGCPRPPARSWHSGCGGSSPHSHIRPPPRQS